MYTYLRIKQLNQYSLLFVQNIQLKVQIPSVDNVDNLNSLIVYRIMYVNMYIVFRTDVAADF